MPDDEFAENFLDEDDLKAFKSESKETRKELRETKMDLKEIFKEDEEEGSEHTAENLLNYLMDKTKSLIDENDRMLREAGDAFVHSSEADMGEVYNGAAKAQADILKTLAGVVAEKDKNKLTRDMKDKDIDIKKQLATMKTSGGPQIGIINMNRQELLDMLAPPTKTIETTVEVEKLDDKYIDEP